MVAIVIGLLVVLAIWKFFPFGRTVFTGPIHVVKKERLQFAIVERGTLESQKNSEIHCHVKAGTRGQVASTIKWLIEDGSEVDKGQLLVQLDDSGFREQESDQIIKVEQARTSAVAAEGDYQIVLSQNNSDIEAAKTAILIAELTQRRYTGDDPEGLEGEYQKLVSDIEGKIKIADSNLAILDERTAWSQRMVKRGFQSRAQLQGDEAKLQSAKIEHANLLREKELLQKYSKELSQVDLKSKLEEAKRALERVKKQADSKETQALSKKKAEQAILVQAENKLDDIQSEIRKCRIISPQKGLVVYFMSESMRFGSSSRQAQVAQGETVTEGQKLMRIPNLNKMQVSVRVHEAMYAHIKADTYKSTGFTREMAQAALLAQPGEFFRLAAMGSWSEVAGSYRRLEVKLAKPGQPAFIRVDAYPNRVFKGHVSSVANVASSAEFYSSDIKVYPSIVTIDEDLDVNREGLRPGMSAEVTVVADDGSEEVLTVPIQSVVGTIAMGEQRKCFVLNAENEPEERDIEVGRSNEKMVEVRKGLSVGDRVVQNPRPLLTGDRAKMKPGTPGTQRGSETSTGDGTQKKKGRGKGGAKGPGIPPPGLDPGLDAPEFRDGPLPEPKQFTPKRKA